MFRKHLAEFVEYLSEETHEKTPEEVCNDYHIGLDNFYQWKAFLESVDPAEINELLKR